MEGGMKRGNGFTLIELLVVIAIIAILAAILFPVFSRAKEQARMTTCKSNMKQLSAAAMMYINDWNGCFPDHAAYGIPYGSTSWDSFMTNFGFRYLSGGQPAGLGKALGKYLKSMNVFNCPSEWKTIPDTVWTMGVSKSPREFPSYYVKYASLFYANYYKHPLRLSEVALPSRAAYLHEGAWHNTEGVWPFLWDTGHFASAPSNKASVRINCVFFDGHVGSYDVPYEPGQHAYDSNWYRGGKESWELPKGACDK